jgi:hypothetical protein
MDTDDLTEMAYDVIVCASRVSDTLKAELSAMASRFKSENEWLKGVRAHLEEITEDPSEYVDYWNLENEEGVTAIMIRRCAEDLCSRVDKILARPINKRGTKAW